MICSMDSRSACALAAIAVLASSMVACTDQVRTGVFIDGPVIGLRYESLTRSGLTNEDGEFEYDEGETVTFSVGGVVLGTTKGAKQVSPFDLFGVTPPTSALAIRNHLTDNVVSDFDRAVNVCVFLQALDADRDPSNGIDVTFWGAGLAGVSLGFDETFAEFAFESFDAFAAAQPGIDRHLDIASVLPHVYASLGLTVSGRLMATATFERDGITNQSGTYAYDALGRLIRLQYTSVSAPAGENVFEYNARGQTTSRALTSDLDANGTFERIEGTTWTYDDDGNLTVEQGLDTTGGVIGTKRTRTFEHDIAGNIVRIVNESDNAGNGSVEQRSETTSVFASGQRRSTRVAYDNDNDGTIDRVTSDAQTFDANGNVTQVVNETDGDGDGVVDARETITRVYDDAGRVLTETTELRVGTLLSSSRTSTFTYDGDNLSGQELEADDDGDGALDYRRTRTTGHDVNGRAISELTTIDADADGTVDQSVTQVWVYDDNQNLVSDVVDVDTDGDGVIDNRATGTRTYDELGNPVSLRRDDDDGADGVIDRTSLETRTYVDLADALYALVRELAVN